MPFPLVARDWLVRSIYKEIPTGYMLINVFAHPNEPDVPAFNPSTLKEGNGRIRGFVSSLCIFERLPFGQTKFTYIVKMDIKGDVPKVVADSGISGSVEVV